MKETKNPVRKKRKLVDGIEIIDFQKAHPANLSSNEDSKSKIEIVEQPTAYPKINKNLKVAIVGFAPTWNLAPYDDKSVEIWGMNELYKVVPRVDVLFEMHTYDLLRSKTRDPKHLEWLQKSKIPIWMLEQYEDIPNSMRYPKEQILAKFGTYFTNSISYMIALAIMAEVKELYIYGIDMATSKEYQIERPSVEFFIGWAKGAGIRVTIPPQSDICKTMYLYGYENDKISETVLKMRSRRAELQKRMMIHQAQAEKALGAMNQMLGAVDDMGYWERCWVYGDPGKDTGKPGGDIHVSS